MLASYTIPERLSPQTLVDTSVYTLKSVLMTTATLTPEALKGVQVACPAPGCDMKASIRGVKHHYTSVHAGGQSGLLQVVVVPVPVEVPRRRRSS